MFKESKLKTIEIENKEIIFTKQNMWLISSYNNVEIERIELFGKTENEGIEELKKIVEKMLK